MLLDRLLTALEVSVDPFAICDVRAGWRLQMPPVGSVGLHYVLRGGGELIVPGGARTAFGPRSLIVVPPGSPHRIEPDGGARTVFDVGAACRRPSPGVRALVAGEGEEVLLLACGNVRATYAGGVNLFAHLRAPLVVRFNRAELAIETAFTGLLEEQARPGPGTDAMMSAYMTQGLIAMVRRVYRDSEALREGAADESIDAASLRWLSALDDPRLARALARMLEAPGESHTLESLAKIAGMSRSSFSEHFAATFGVSPMELLRETRLRRAAQLLRTSDRPIKTIAAEVGFSSRSHFSRAFKSFTGSEPTQYRARPDS
ncbi:MAG: AraC family transcriptional regulator [Myxococcales bacterium]|nr:AraC family transcriptional regulator [Myxococcales bacterium]